MLSGSEPKGGGQHDSGEPGSLFGRVGEAGTAVDIDPQGNASSGVGMRRIECKAACMTS